jgi:hypothetical protein
LGRPLPARQKPNKKFRKALNVLTERVEMNENYQEHEDTDIQKTSADSTIVNTALPYHEKLRVLKTFVP